MSRTFFALVFFLTCISFSARAGDDLPDGVTIGDKAPDFVVMSVDSQRVSLGNYANSEGVILIFTCNHCPYSKAYEDRIIQLHKTFAPKGWPVLAINPNDPAIEPEDGFEQMQERAKEKNFPFVYAFDATQKLAKAYGARRTPHTFLLHKTKTGFVVEYIGSIDDSPREPESVSVRFVEDAIKALSSGTAPATTSTKAIGCTIKWRVE
jgi:peroxiredoxin